MVSTEIVGNDLIWRNPTGKLAVLHNYNKFDHTLIIKNKKTFEVERLVASMDDTYTQHSWKAFFPEEADSDMTLHRRIMDIIYGKYISGEEEIVKHNKEHADLINVFKSASLANVRG